MRVFVISCRDVGQPLIDVPVDTDGGLVSTRGLSSPSIQQMLLHYRLAEKIGEGGMGVVWRALDTKLDREVAIKVLPEIFARDAERLSRFEREAKLLAALNHPNIAAI